VSTGARAEGRDPGRLTFSYTENDDGRVTVQIVEFPSAISQGATREEAQRNVLDALHDLTH
jgi:predicted RNase H-like HicB family nuclease